MARVNDWDAGGIGTKDVSRVVGPFLIRRNEMEEAAGEADESDDFRPVGGDFENILLPLSIIRGVLKDDGRIDGRHDGGCDVEDKCNSE